LRALNAPARRRPRGGEDAGARERRDEKHVEVSTTCTLKVAFRPFNGKVNDLTTTVTRKFKAATTAEVLLLRRPVVGSCSAAGLRRSAADACGAAA
jgi:hypothetical protein